MRRRYGVIIAVVVVLLSANLVLAWERILLGVGNFLVVQDKIQPADVIHVIAGYDHRTDYGIELYKQGYGRKIFFTGGLCRHHKGNHAIHARKLGINHGVAPQDIVTDETEINSTYSEAARLKEFITKNLKPINSVIVVSDPHHMRRTRWTYRRVLGDEIKVRMAPVPFELTPYKQDWWEDLESRKFVKNEYKKIIYYYVRYKFSWGSLKEWLASLDHN